MKKIANNIFGANWIEPMAHTYNTNAHHCSMRPHEQQSCKVYCLRSGTEIWHCLEWRSIHPVHSYARWWSEPWSWQAHTESKDGRNVPNKMELAGIKCVFNIRLAAFPCAVYFWVVTPGSITILRHDSFCWFCIFRRAWWWQVLPNALARLFELFVRSMCFSLLYFWPWGTSPAR